MNDPEIIVREQLRHLGPFRGGAGEAALDALVKERDNAMKIGLVHQTCESRILVAEAERDEAQAQCHTEDWNWRQAVARAEAAESRVRQLESALRRFVSYADDYPEDISGPLRDDFLPILRRALAATSEEGE
jgi:hypothetical protein